MKRVKRRGKSGVEVDDCDRCGEAIPADHARMYHPQSGKQWHVGCAPKRKNLKEEDRLREILKNHIWTNPACSKDSRLMSIVDKYD